MTALESEGTGLLSIVLRLLSNLCHLTEGLGSPAAWHSRLMGSPTLTRTGPAGVTTALGDSKNEIRQKYKRMEQQKYLKRNIQKIVCTT